MPQNTRSRWQGLQQAPPLPLRQTRRRKAPGSSVEDISETLSTPTPISPRRVSISPKRRCRLENSTDDASPDLDFQVAHGPTALQEADHLPGHVKIAHFDFNKYRPSTPGSKSAPIKIEDSPKSSSSLSIDAQKSFIHQKPLTSPVLLPKETAIGYDRQAWNYHANGSPFMALQADPVLSEGVTSIITSPKAATTFLHCFLASEKFWMRSLDYDMDPDCRFWMNIVRRFNGDPHGYRINTWLTARTVASTLCSQPYKAQVEKQLPGDADCSSLISAIDDCRRMSQRRRREQQSGFKSLKTRINGMEARQDAQKGVLGRKPQTLEDQKKLLQTLATRCAESTHVTGPRIDQLKGRPKLDNQNKRKGVYVQPDTVDLSSRDENHVHKESKDNLHALGVTRRNSNKRSETWKGGDNRLPERCPDPPAARGRGDQRGNPSSSIYTAQDRDKHRLEQRVSELERTIKCLKRPRYSY